jgi:hypothetical protein
LDEWPTVAISFLCRQEGEEDDSLDAQIKHIQADPNNRAKDVSGYDVGLTMDAALKIIELRAPGRLLVDAKDQVWVCDPKRNTWTTSLDHVNMFLYDLRDDIEQFKSGKPSAQLIRHLHIDRNYRDYTLHEKLDLSLKPGQLPFRNGYLLDLSSNESCFLSLKPTDFVSVNGVVDRDLPEDDCFERMWKDDRTFAELQALFRKQYSDEVSYQQVMERVAWAVLHGKPNDAKFWIELYGPPDSGKTATFAALAQCLPGVVKKIPIAMFSTSAKRSPEGPNEALAELQGVRLGYGEEPSTRLQLDGGYLKDCCGGDIISCSRKNEHQIRFRSTMYPVLISNNDTELEITPNDEATRKKRLGWLMMQKFTNDEAEVDEANGIFLAVNGFRDIIATDYFVATLRLLHDLYVNIPRNPGGKPIFNSTATEYHITYSPPEVGPKGMQYWVDQYECFHPASGAGLGMKDIYDELLNRGFNELTQQQFFNSTFKQFMKRKISTYCTAKGLDPTVYTSPRLGSRDNKFKGIRLSE